MKKHYLLPLFTLIVLASVMFSCNNKQENKVEEVCVEVVECEQIESIQVAPTTSYSYTILSKEESSFPLPDNQQITKMTYTLEIQSELSESALDEIADVIAYSDSHEYIFVEYYLPTQLKNGPNYGISKRTPSERSSQVNYIAPPAKEEATVKAPYDGCKVYGKWNMMGATLIVYQKGNKCYMVNYYGGSNYGEPERFIKTTYRGRTAFKNAEDPDDVYVINGEGNLDGYYCGDYASTFTQAY